MPMVLYYQGVISHNFDLITPQGESRGPFTNMVSLNYQYGLVITSIISVQPMKFGMDK